MTDAELLARAQRGDGKAWDQLHERLFPSAWREACARLNDRTVAEDITAETMLALVRNLNTLQPESCRMHGWVRQVVRNKISDWARRNERRRRALQDIADRSPDVPLDATGEALAAEQRVAVAAILAEMREDHRMVLELKYAENLSVCEIGRRTDQTEKAVESLLFRARNEFRRKYELAGRRAGQPTSVTMPP